MRPLWLLALPISCLAPTEVTLSIKTDAKCSDLQGVAIAIGQPAAIDSLPPTTVTLDCQPDGTIGTLGVVPGAAGDDLGVRVVAGFKRSVNDCNAPFGDGCIVARRELRYVPHTPLYLPIELSVDCAGVPCDSTSTCVDGQCKPSSVPDPTSCTTPDGCSLGDAGTAPLGFDPQCGDTSGLAAGASWPMTNVCPTHIARTPYVGPKTTPQIAWSYSKDPAAVYSTPIITSDGSVFFGQADGSVTALDLATGALRWSSAADNTNRFSGNGAVGADGTLVVAGSNAVVGFDSVTHAARWKINQSGSDVTIGAGEIAYEAAGATFHAIDATSGVELWQVPTTASTAATFYSPAIAPDGAMIYLGADDGTLVAIGTTTHATAWSRTLAGGGVPVAVGTNVLVSTRSSAGLVAYTSTNTLLWSFAGTTNFCVALAKDGTIVTTSNNALVGLDPSSGKQVWSVPSPNDIISCLVIDAADTVYGITSQNDVVAFDPKTTSGPIWRETVTGALDVVLAKDGTLLVNTGDGHVHALR